MAPLFIQRSRQRATEAQETFAEEAATSLPPRARNPFTDAARDLAADWDAMVVDRDSARDEAERHRAENVYLSGKVDELTRELAHRVSFFELELDRLQKQRDQAVDQDTDRRAKLEIISRALLMVLNETIASAPMKRDEPIEEPPPRTLSTAQRPVRDFAQTPPEGYPVDEADAEGARDLINRLVPIALKR